MTMQPLSSSSEPTLPLPPRAPSPPNLPLSSNNINQDSHRNTSLTRSLPNPRLSSGVPPRGTVYVVERIGRFNRLLYFSRTNSPLLPLVDRVVAAYTTRRVEQSTSSNGIIAAVCNTRVRVHATWTLRVVDPKKLAYRIADVDRCIMMLISVRIRDALSMASEAIINQDVENLRPISDTLRNDIHQTCSKFGVACLAFRFDSIRNLPQQQQQKYQQQQNTAPNSMAQNLYGPHSHLHTPKSLNIADAYHSPADYYTAAAIDSILPELPSDNVTHPVIPASIPSLHNFKPSLSHSQSNRPARNPYQIPQYPQSVQNRHQRTYWNHELSRNYNYDMMASQSRSQSLPNTEIEREGITPIMTGSNMEYKMSPPKQSLLSPVPPLSKVVLPTAHSPPPKTSSLDANYSPGYSSDNEDEALPNRPIEFPPMSPLPQAGSRRKEDSGNYPPTIENGNIYTTFDPDVQLNVSEPPREDPAPAPPPTPAGLSVNSATSDSETTVSEMEEDEKQENEVEEVVNDKVFEKKPKEDDSTPNFESVPVEDQVKEIVPTTSTVSNSVVTTQEADDSNHKPKNSGSVLYAPPPSPTGETEESTDVSPELLPMALSRVLLCTETPAAGDADRKAVPLGTPNDQPPSTGSGAEAIKSPPLASYLDSLPATPRSELPSSENGSDTPTDREEGQALALHTPGVGQTETSLSSLPSEIPSSSVTGDEPLGDAADVPNAVHVQDRAIENVTQIPGASEEKPGANEDANIQPPSMPVVFQVMPERPLREMGQSKEEPSQLNVDVPKEVVSPPAKRKEQTSHREAPASASRETTKRRVQQPAASILQSVVGKAERAIKNAGASLAPDLFEGPAKLLQSPSSTPRIRGPPLTAKKALRMDMPRTPLPSRTPPPPALGRPMPSPATARLPYGKQPDDRMRRMPSPYEGSTRDPHLPRPRDLGAYHGEEEFLEGRLPRRNTPRYVGPMESASHTRPMPRPGLDDPRMRPSHSRINPLMPPDFQLTDEDEYTARKEQKRRDRMVNNINNMEQWRHSSSQRNDDSTDNDSTEMWVDAGSDSEREKFDDDAISQMSQNASRSSRRRHKSKNRRRHESSSRRNKSSKSRKRPEPEDNSDSDNEEEKEEEIEEEVENRSGESSEEDICLECGHHRHHEEIDDAESHRSSSRKSRSKHSSRHSEDGTEKSSSSRSQRRKKASSERSVDTHRSSSSRDRSSRSKKGSSKDKDKDRRRKSEREESVPRRSKSSGDRKRSQSKSRSSKKRRDDGDNRVQVKSSKSRTKDVSTTYSYNPYSYDAGDVTPIYRHRLPDSDTEQDDPIPWYCEGQSAPDTDFEDEERRSDDSDKYMNSVNYTNLSTFSSYGRRDKSGNRRRSAHNRRVRFLYDDLR